MAGAKEFKNRDQGNWGGERVRVVGETVVNGFNERTLNWW